MKRTGPDSLSSWMAVLYCSLISMLLYGVVRLSGVMFVASMDQFQVDRQSASVPYILCDFFQALAGPVTGFLSLKFGSRQVMILGSFISAVGTGTCFFAQNIETVTILWGVVYGVGFGLSSLLLPIIITQHFLKWRATAISLVYVGSYVGFSFLPSIADLLIRTYGLSGTYLFLSGFLLHCVPLSMLLRNPDTGQAEENLAIERSRATSISILPEYGQGDMKDSKCNLNDRSFNNAPIKNLKTAHSEKEIYEKGSDALSETTPNHKIKQQDNHPKRRFSVEFLNCGDLENVGNLDTVTKCNKVMNNEGFDYAKIKSPNVEKEIPVIHETRQHTANTRRRSCFARVNEGFRSEEGIKCDNNHQYPIEFFKPTTNCKYPEHQIEYVTATPKLMNYEQIGSSNIFLTTTSKSCYTDIFINPGVEKRHSFSSELFPTFINRVRPSETLNGEILLKHPLKINRRTSAIFGNALMRRPSVISKQELSISKGLTIFFEPIFLLVLFGNAVYSFSFITFITVIVDFTTDISMSESDGKFVIMVFSIASNIGLLSFGWVTDRGYLSLTNFTALMFFLRTVTLCAIPLSNGFGMLMSIVSVQGFVEASLANMFPLIVAEYYAEEIHELAISCTFFLCGPMYLGTPLLIGFFRDDNGSYLYLFLLMAILSLICSILHFIAPLLAKWRCGRDDWILRKL